MESLDLTSGVADVSTLDSRPDWIHRAIHSLRTRQIEADWGENEMNCSPGGIKLRYSTNSSILDSSWTPCASSAIVVYPDVLQGLSFVEIKTRSRKRQNETRKRSNAFNSPHYLVSFRTQKALLLFICWMVCLTVKPSLVRSCSNRTIWPDGTNNPFGWIGDW